MIDVDLEGRIRDWWYGSDKVVTAPKKKTNMKIDLVEVARYQARKFHADQTYGQHPYTYHLAETARVLFYIGGSGCAHLTAACHLHDILEDTPCTVRDLRQMGMTDRVIEIVQAFTDEPGKNRKERKAKTYPKIAKLEDAVIVKLCDRIANVTFSFKEVVSLHKIHREKAEDMLSLYAKEHKEFCEKLLTNQEHVSATKHKLQDWYLTVMSKVL